MGYRRQGSGCNRQSLKGGQSINVSIMPSRETIQRQSFVERFRANRVRSARLFRLVQDAMYERPLTRRMPFIFYLGHLPAFAHLTLAQRALGLPPIDAKLETLFRRWYRPR